MNAIKGNARTSGRKQSALPMGEVRALPVQARAILTSFFVAWHLFSPSHSQADEIDRFKSLAETCSEAIKISSDRFATRLITAPMADELERLANTFSDANKIVSLLPDLNESAADCIAFSRQINGEVIFSPAENRYVSARNLAATLQAEQQAQERAQRTAEMLEEQRRTEEVRIAEQLERDALNLEINSRIYSACSELSQRDPTEAYTNVVCIDAFRENGLPPS